MGNKMRFGTAMGMVAGVLLSMVTASAVRADDSPLDDPAAVKTLLETKLPLFDRDKLTIGGAVRLVADLANANVYLDTAALGAAGYDLAAKNVFVSAQNITLGTALDRLVKTISLSKLAKSPVKWDVENGVIVISTVDDKNWTAIPNAGDKNAKEDAYKDDRVLADVTFDDVALHDAISVLRDNNVNVYFHWDALEKGDVDRHDRVSLILKRVRPRTAVQLLVRALAGPRARVSFAVRDSVWMISTPDDIAKQMHLWDWRPQHVKDQTSADKMAQNMEDVGFNATPLGDAVDMLARSGEISMDVDWAGLGAAHIDRSTPITANVRHVRLATAINLLLTEAGGVDHELDYNAKDATVSVIVKPPPATKPTPTTKPGIHIITKTVTKTVTE